LNLPLKNIELVFGQLKVSVAQIADPDKLFDQLLAKNADDENLADERIPYWAELWPSAIALSQFLAANPSLVKGKDVLEIGCGPALPSIVAAMSGGNVEVTDYLPEALNLAQHNLQLNSITSARTSLLDWRNPGNRKADVVLASDVAYESRSFEPLIKALRSLTRPGGRIILSEPNRKFSSIFFDTLKREGFTLSQQIIPVEKDGLKYRVSVYSLESS
jgi:predicted nicotinamide N-methyase